MLAIPYCSIILSQEYTLQSYLFSSGGGTTSGDVYATELAIGEDIVSPLISGGNYSGSVGFFSTLYQLVPTAKDDYLPKSFRLDNPYPNPFNPWTTIQYELPVHSDIQIAVHDVAGREIWSYRSDHQSPGYYSIVWHGVNVSGKPMPSGIYMIWMKAGSQFFTQKVVLLK